METLSDAKEVAEHLLKAMGDSKDVTSTLQLAIEGIYELGKLHATQGIKDNIKEATEKGLEGIIYENRRRLYGEHEFLRPYLK